MAVTRSPLVAVAAAGIGIPPAWALIRRLPDTTRLLDPLPTLPRFIVSEASDNARTEITLVDTWSERGQLRHAASPIP